MDAERIGGGPGRRAEHARGASGNPPTDKPAPTVVAWTGWHRRLAALAAALATVPLVYAAMLVSSESERVAGMDRAVAEGLHDLVSGDPAAEQALVWVGQLSGPWLLRAGALALAVGLLLRGRRRMALWLAVTVTVGGLVGLGLKLVVQRARPAFDEPVYVASGYSFPSGHAMTSMLVCTAVLVVLWAGLSRRRRAAGVASAAVFVLVVAFDRMALGVHYLTDVVAGWAVGLAVVTATAAALLGPDDLR